MEPAETVNSSDLKRQKLRHQIKPIFLPSAVWPIIQNGITVRQSFSGAFIGNSPSYCAIKYDGKFFFLLESVVVSLEFRFLSLSQRFVVYNTEGTAEFSSKRSIELSADSSYRVFTEASYFHQQQENVFDNGKINLNVTFEHQSPLCLSLNYYIIKFSALARDRMDVSLQDWNTIQHLQSSCFLWNRQMLHGLENNLWFHFSWSYLSGFKI